MALLLAVRNLIQDKLRLFLSILGVTLAVMLVLILNGFVTGLYKQVSAYLDHSPGSVVVAQQGVTNLLGATSLLPPGAKDGVLDVDGVARAVPILSQFIILDLHDLKQPAYLIGYPEGEGEPGSRGGPWKMSAGREPKAEDEVVFDAVLAERHGLGLEDRFEIMGVPFEIVGLSSDSTSWMTSFIFMTKPAAEHLLRAPGATSILLVEAEDLTDEQRLVTSLANLKGVDALTKAAVIENDTKLLVEVFSAPLQLMAGIAFLVGVLVVGLVIYTATVERRREYGVLKAVGSPNATLYAVVGVQALISAGIGGLGGIGLAALFAAGIMQVWPEFLILLTPDSAWLALTSSLGMSVLSALVPARAVASVEPADVFRQGG